MRPSRTSCEPVHSRERVLHLLRAAKVRQDVLALCTEKLAEVEPRLLCGRMPSMVAASLYYWASRDLSGRCGGMMPDGSLPPTREDALDLIGSGASGVSVGNFVSIAIQGRVHDCGAPGCKRVFSTPRAMARHRFLFHRLKDPGFFGCLECLSVFRDAHRERDHAWEFHQKPRLVEAFERERGRRPKHFMELDLWMREKQERFA